MERTPACRKAGSTVRSINGVRAPGARLLSPLIHTQEKNGDPTLPTPRRQQLSKSIGDVLAGLCIPWHAW